VLITRLPNLSVSTP
jgi:hypothetical protein